MTNLNSITLAGNSGIYRAFEINARVNTFAREGGPEMDELCEFCLVDGRALNRRDGQTFVVVETGEVLHIVAK